MTNYEKALEISKRTGNRIVVLPAAMGMNGEQTFFDFAQNNGKPIETTNIWSKRAELKYSQSWKDFIKSKFC